jgi:hypothetical protein
VFGVSRTAASHSSTHSLSVIFDGSVYAPLFDCPSASCIASSAFFLPVNPRRTVTFFDPSASVSVAFHIHRSPCFVWYGYAPPSPGVRLLPVMSLAPFLPRPLPR